jgi:deoxyadenosine/deoxycytidine kinase
MRLISIEGNIGTGKTTFIQIFTKLLSTLYPDHEIVFLKEPIDEWFKITNDDNRNILDYFYKDQLRWSYSFQMNAFITRMKQIEQYADKNVIVVCERCVYTDRNVFASLLKESGKINTMEWKLYDEWFYWLTQKEELLPSHYIYLKADYTTSYERMLKRARSEEETIPMVYIKKVAEKHDEWMDTISDDKKTVFDVNMDFETCFKRQSEMMETLHKLLQR